MEWVCSKDNFCKQLNKPCIFSVKRQLLRYQSPITGLFPVFSSDTEVGSVRESVYCAAAVWGLYQAYRWFL